MTTIRPASASASSRYWVVNMMVDPSATRSRIVSHIWLRLRGSRPVVGSSRKISAGLVIRLAAHPAGEPRDRAVSGLREVELREEVVADAVGLLGGQTLQATEQPEVL